MRREINPDTRIETNEDSGTQIMSLNDQDLLASERHEIETIVTSRALEFLVSWIFGTLTLRGPG